MPVTPLPIKTWHRRLQALYTFQNSSCRTPPAPMSSHQCADGLINPSSGLRHTGQRDKTGDGAVFDSSRGVIVVAAHVPAVVPGIVIIVGLVVCFIARIVADGAAPA
jgi:hypothetical protein